VNFLLDTDTCIYYLNGNPNIRARIVQHGASALCLCEVTLAELYFGAYHSSRREENLAKVRELPDLIAILPSDTAAAEHFGRTKAELKRTGQLIDDFDCMIASHALAHDLVLVTNNVSHFSRIQGLRIENCRTAPQSE
jgi:tRNA(fMet)-specific endonuclease VapC